MFDISVCYQISWQLHFFFTKKKNEMWNPGREGQINQNEERVEMKCVDEWRTAHFSSRASAVCGLTLRYLQVGLP